MSVNGARILVPANAMRSIRAGERIIMRFQPMAPLATNELPLTVRSVVRDEGGIALGSEFAVDDVRQYKMVADLVFANPDEWSRFQATRRKNIGVVRGVIEFIQLAIFQTVRGLSYLMRSAPTNKKAAQSDNAAAESNAPSAPPTFAGADPNAVVTGAGSTAALSGVPIGRSANHTPDR